MPIRSFFAALSLTVTVSPALAQTVQVVDCDEPANQNLDECAPSELGVPSLATNAAPLLALPLGLLALGGLGGGGDSDGTPNTSTPTTN